MTARPSDTPLTDGIMQCVYKALNEQDMERSIAYREAAEFAIATLERQLTQARQELAEAKETLQFVERWANHHGQKACISPAEALSCIQHYPPIIAITRSYADGKVPETRNPWAELAEAREKALEEAAIAIESADKTKWVVASRDVVAAEIRALKDKP